MNVFQAFENGKLLLPEELRALKEAAWTPHASFEGVELKHLITAADSDGNYSYHLVRVAPGKKIGLHTHDTQLETHEVIAGSGICISDGKQLLYESGVLSVLPSGVPHEVLAGNDGLYLFAKFIPALC